MASSSHRRITRDDAIAWLDRRLNFERTAPGDPAGRGVFGLARMRRLLAGLGDPHHRVPAVHVAGTKGKGSTVAMIAAVLQAAGHRVGRYLSPHVDSIEERICVGGRPVSAEDFAAAFAVVMPVVDRMDAAAARRRGRGPTWFEVLTAAAFVHFARTRVDIAVLETGLGGRLDATNVAHPLVCVITSISLDHMQILGSTIGRIAGEKAGIIKRGCPVVSGAVHAAARRVIRATAARRRAPLLELDRDFTVEHRPAAAGRGGAIAPGTAVVTPSAPGGDAGLVVPLGMSGAHQAANAALAVMAVRCLEARGMSVGDRAIRAGVASARLPARIEQVGTDPLVVLDAAHNVASMQSLLETLGPVFAAARPRVLLFAASADKQIEEMLALARGRFEHVIVTRYATNPRAATLTRLIDACGAAGLPPPRSAGAPAEALALARSLATRRGAICVAGSFFLASEIRPLL